MASTRKFSTSIILFLVAFMGISLVSIASVVYVMRSRNALKESLGRFEGRKVELARIIELNMEILEQELSEFAADPLLVDSLARGTLASLPELMASRQFTIDGVHLTLYDNRSRQFLQDLTETFPGIDGYLKTPTRPEPDNFKFHQVGKDTITVLSSPVMDASRELGRCYLVFNLSEDTKFQGILKSMGVKDPHIIFHDGEDGLYDVETGEKIESHGEITLPDDVAQRASLPFDFLPQQALLPLDHLPGMYFAVSMKPTIDANQTLLKVLAFFCSAFLCVIFVVAVLLSKMVTRPLEVLAQEAFETAREPSDRFLREERTGYIEFRQISSAFNQVLANLSELQKRSREEAKKELDASEERYRLTLEAAPDCITINSLVDGRFIQINEAFVKISGYSRKEIVGKSNEDLNLFVDPSALERLKEAARRKGGVNGIEVQHRRKDGAIIDSVVSARTVDFENEPCILCVVSDRTAQKKAEKEQRKLEAALQRATKMEAIGTMAGGVAHDLNNILSGIVSYPELLLMDLPPDSPLRPAVQTIQKSGQRAAAIVQDMLTLARRGVPVTEVVDINAVIGEYLKSPEHQALLSDNPGVRVQVELGSGVLNLIGSGVHIGKSLMNLVSNAVEAMPEGGALRISSRNQYVDSPIRRYDTVKEGDYVVLAVSDTGTGISPEDQERIFEPFYTRKKMGRSGTGLGMAVVWGTVKDHSGYIDLESRPGQGTTFQLYFPATRKAFVKAPPQVLREAYRGKGERILVVDDVAEQRKIAATILERLGYEVASVASGEEALEYLRENRADLLVLDMVMEPGMDGLETYRKVLELHPRQRAVIASGFSETDRVREAQGLGAGPYIRKPYLMENIGIAVRKELDRQ